MATHTLDPKITTKWDNGEYGRSDEHVAPASKALHAELDEALAMKLVSIRLPIPLIETLKMIAQIHGVAYQPMIRDLLTRFASSEINTLAHDMESRMRAAQKGDESSPPVESFMERMRACG